MSKDYCILKHIQHLCLKLNETQEEAHFHGDLPEHLLVVIFSISSSEQDR
jgi:hypothetical protein